MAAPASIAAQAALDLDDAIASGDIGVEVTWSPPSGVPLLGVAILRRVDGGDERPGADSLGQAETIMVRRAEVDPVELGTQIEIATSGLPEVWEVMSATLDPGALVWRCRMHRIE